MKFILIKVGDNYFRLLWIAINFILILDRYSSSRRNMSVREIFILDLLNNGKNSVSIYD